MTRLAVTTRVALWFSLAALGVSAGGIALSTYFLFRAVRSEIDADLARDFRRVVSHLEPTASGGLRLRGSYRYSGYGSDGSQRFLDILSPAGDVLLRTPRPPKRDVHVRHVPPEAEPTVSSQTLPDGLRVRARSAWVHLGERRYLVQLAHSEMRLWSALRAQLRSLAYLLPLMMAAAALLGYQLARQALAPVREMTAAARRIRAENLEERLPLPGVADEIHDLGLELNTMLDRIAADYHRMRQLTADASHELRTPIATLRTLGEVALARSPEPQADRETLLSMMAIIRHMGELVEGLLLIARAEEGRLPVHLAPIDLVDVLRETAEIVEPLVEESDLCLEVHAEKACPTCGDRSLLRQAILNLVENAVKHTPTGGRITLEAWRSGAEVGVEVSDTGEGVDLEAHPDLFRRFYRADASRSRETGSGGGGAGLGLAIVGQIVRLHSGRTLARSRPGEGATFGFALPLSPRTEEALPARGDARPDNAKSNCAPT